MPRREDAHDRDDVPHVVRRPLQVRQREGRHAVATEPRAQECEQRLILVDRKQPSVRDRPPARHHAVRHQAHFPEKGSLPGARAGRHGVRGGIRLCLGHEPGREDQQRGRRARGDCGYRDPHQFVCSMASAAIR